MVVCALLVTKASLQDDLGRFDFRNLHISNQVSCCFAGDVDFFDIEGLSHYRHHGHFDFMMVAEVFVALVILSLRFFDDFKSIFLLRSYHKDRPPTS